MVTWFASTYVYGILIAFSMPWGTPLKFQFPTSSCCSTIGVGSYTGGVALGKFVYGLALSMTAVFNGGIGLASFFSHSSGYSAGVENARCCLCCSLYFGPGGAAT